MKLFHISDTHGLHAQVKIPEGTDIIVHSGDASNNRDPFANLPEFGRFVVWFEALPVEHKIYVPGNHDMALARGLITESELRSRGITVLNEAETEIKGLRFFGSPWVPRYGDWAYMVNRDKLHERWQHIPEDVDVLITHGPPFGILDATYGTDHKYELVGCRALRKRVEVINPKYMLFGHVHDCKDIPNAGTRTVAGLRTLFSNGACCMDGKYDTITSNGNLIDIL
jgi:Icc-related predicted phosphoesterase